MTLDTSYTLTSSNIVNTFDTNVRLYCVHTNTRCCTSALVQAKVFGVSPADDSRTATSKAKPTALLSFRPNAPCAGWNGGEMGGLTMKEGVQWCGGAC